MFRGGVAILAMAMLAGCGRLGFESLTSDAQDAGAVDASVVGPDAEGSQGSWQEFGNSGSGEGISETPTANAGHSVLGISPTGVVHVLYSTDISGTNEVYLKRWTGSEWEGIGTSADPGGISASDFESSPGSLAFGPDNQPHVAWMIFDGARSIHYRHYDGTSWVERMGSATGRGVSGGATPWWPSVAVSESGIPFIAYETYNVIPSGGAIHLKTEAGAAWQGLANSDQAEGLSGADGNSQLTRIAVDGEDVYVVWQEARPEGMDIYASHFSPGEGWQALGTSLSPGGISQSSTRSERPTIRVRAGQIVVSWTEETVSGRRAYLKHFDGTDWVALGGSASGDGLGPADTEIEAVHCALLPNGKPVAIWSQPDGSVSDIYARQWDGNAWVPVGPTGNVSNTAGRSIFPTIEISGSGAIFAAWIEYVEADRSAIYMRAFAPE